MRVLKYTVRNDFVTFINISPLIYVGNNDLTATIFKWMMPNYTQETEINLITLISWKFHFNSSPHHTSKKLKQGTLFILHTYIFSFDSIICESFCS